MPPRRPDITGSSGTLRVAGEVRPDPLAQTLKWVAGGWQADQAGLRQDKRTSLTCRNKRAGRDSNPNRQIRRQVLTVHPVAVGLSVPVTLRGESSQLASVRSGDGWKTATGTATPGDQYHPHTNSRSSGGCASPMDSFCCCLHCSVLPSKPWASTRTRDGSNWCGR